MPRTTTSRKTSSTIATSESDYNSPTSRLVNDVFPAEDRDCLPFSVGAMPHNILALEYAVRGEVAVRAEELKNDPNRKFDKLVYCNIGNPQIVGVPSVSYLREYTGGLVSWPRVGEMASDIRTRVEDTMREQSRFGPYTHSQGLEPFRKVIAEYLQRRDGGPTPPLNTIFMGDGASNCAEGVLSCVLTPGAAVLLPKPCYPLYQALAQKYRGEAFFYDLDESSGWEFDVDTLETAYLQASAAGATPRIVVAINPGNPVPSLFSRANMLQILEFAEKRNVMIIADEVYQENVHDPEAVAIPFRKLAIETGSKVQITSLFSVSKGPWSECGARGGFMQLHNVEPSALAVLYKIRSCMLCPNIVGQAVVAAAVTPPEPGDASYELFAQERASIVNGYKLKAEMVTKFFNSLPHCSAKPIRAGMYAFPSIDFSEKAKQAAAAAGKSIEIFYCLALLEATGIVTAPGCGFGQKPGSHHIRLTILPEVEMLTQALDRYRSFHAAFFEMYK